MKNLPVNKTGYLKGAKTAKNPVNIIPSNIITTEGMAFPIKANGKTLYPNTGQYKFPTSHVVETPLKQNGSNKIEAGPVLKKAIKEHSKPKPVPKPAPKKQLEDDDSWLENAWEIADPTGISSHDDIYRSYKNTGLSRETALEAFGALPFIGKIGKSGKIISGGVGLLHKLAPKIKYLPKGVQAKAQKKLFDVYQNYSKNGGKEIDNILGKTTEWFRDNIPYINPNSQKYIPAARHAFNYSQTGAKVKSAISTFLGSKDNSGFKYDPNAKDNTLKFDGRNIFPTMSSEYMYQEGTEEAKASEAAKFTYRIKDKKRRDTQVRDMYNNTLDSFRGDTTNAKRNFKSFFTHYGSERLDGIRPITGYYGFDRKDYENKTLDSLGRDWHKQMRVSKKDDGTKSTKPFDLAFAKARKAGEKNFTFNGKSFTTDLKEEPKKATSKPKVKIDYNDGRKFKLSEGLRKRIYNSVNPDEYPLIETIPAIGRFTSGRKVTDEESKNVTQADKDAWAFYMGVPQKEKTVTRSKYTPTENKIKSKTKYYTVRNAYPAFEDSVVSNASKAFANQKDFWKKASDVLYGNKDTENRRTGVESSFRPLQNVTYSKGKDKKGYYYSIYDTYDFDVPFSNKVGNPYEVYDRVYYDSTTGKPLSVKKQGSKDMKPLIKYKDGSKGVSLAFSRGEKDPKGGLTQKGVDKYNRATGGNLKMAVTTPPSKLKPGSKAANRRKSFCARMSGVKGPMAKNGKPTRKALALRKWNC